MVNETNKEKIINLERQVDELHKQLVQMTQDNNLLQYHLQERITQLQIYEERIANLMAQVSQLGDSCKIICEKKLRTLRNMLRAKLKEKLKMPFNGIFKEASKKKAGKGQGSNSLATDYEIFEQSIQTQIASFWYKPKISIILPVYNGEECWLRVALESVFAQYYSNWELCICNDGSTAAHVAEVLKEYDALDSRIKVKHLPQNRGVAAASNQALELAVGEYVGFLDHDDWLTPDALFEVVKLLQTTQADLIYSDEAIMEEHGAVVYQAYRPDWSPDMLFSHPYFVHFNVFRIELVRQIGGFREHFPVSQDYDFILRFTAKTDRISHIPRILYHWRQVNSSASHTNQNQVMKLSKQALVETLAERGIVAVVEDGLDFNLFRVRRLISGNPLVSIIIPTKDKVHFLQRCVESILKKTTWPNYEIIIVDNNSTEQATFDYYRTVENQPRIRVLFYNQPFSYAALNNWAVNFANGSHLMFLNNDTEVLSREWLTAMLEHSQRREVGVVGAKLLGIDGRIQHGGVIIGLNGLADHGHRGFAGDSPGYCHTLKMIRNYSAVTAACLMMRKVLFQEVGGFDEQNLPVTYNDVDLCLRLRSKNYLIVYTPYAELYHYESISRGYVIDSREAWYMRTHWKTCLETSDPYYNPNLPLEGGGYYLRD